MMHFRKWLCLILVLLVAQVAQAETIEGLIAAGELEARIVVTSPDPHLQKVPVEIAVEVGTPRWFKRGTRVRDFTVPGTLVRPVSNFAFNETRRRDGDTWAFQSWRFRIYAEHVGDLNPPALTTFISVDTETHGVVEGEISLQVPPLEIEAPPGTEGLTSWVAATEFEVKESWEGLLETYQIGDAVTRVRRFTIKGTPAMAIPASPQIELDGVQVYHAPPLVDDKSVRGLQEGVREERVVFTIEAGGTLSITGHRIHWFNMNTQSVETIDLPGRTLDVLDSVTPNTETASKPGAQKWTWWIWALAILGIALMVILIRWIRRTTLYRTANERLEVLRGHRRAKKDFIRAASQQDSHRCLALLYERMSEHAEWQLSAACAADPKLRAVAAALMAHAYSDGPPPQASELQSLWAGCTKPKERRENQNTLRLNPGPGR